MFGNETDNGNAGQLRAARVAHQSAISDQIVKLDALMQRMRSLHPEMVTPAIFGELRIIHLANLQAQREHLCALLEFIDTVGTALEDDSHQGRSNSSQNRAGKV